MIFHEIYSSYYQAVGRLIAASLAGPLTDGQAAQIIGESAFSDSFLYIADAVKRGQWPVLDRNWKTPLSQAPRRPLSTLERRWLATVCKDRRMALFCSEDGESSWLSRLCAELEDVEPLYAPEDFSVVDSVLQSDPYDDPAYQKHFRVILSALRENRPIAIAFRSGRGKLCRGRYQPQRLEYSQKEDRFRLLARSGRSSFFINLGRILECVAFCAPEKNRGSGASKRQVELELTDERGALERVMVQFADLEKVTKQIGNRRYTIRLTYRSTDETEILIRILSFGPMLKVTGPERFLKIVKERLERQRRVGIVDEQTQLNGLSEH